MNIVNNSYVSFNGSNSLFSDKTRSDEALALKQEWERALGLIEIDQGDGKNFSDNEILVINDHKNFIEKETSNESLLLEHREYSCAVSQATVSFASGCHLAGGKVKDSISGIIESTTSKIPVYSVTEPDSIYSAKCVVHEPKIPQEIVARSKSVGEAGVGSNNANQLKLIFLADKVLNQEQIDRNITISKSANAISIFARDYRESEISKLKKILVEIKGIFKASNFFVRKILMNGKKI